MKNKSVKKIKWNIQTAAAAFIYAWQRKITSFTVYAAEESGGAAGYDLEWIKTQNNRTFDDLTDTVKATGGSLYTLLMAVGVIGLLASLIICGMLIAIGSNANKRSEHLAHLVYIMLGGVVIFGAMAIIGLMQSIGGNL